MGFIRAQNIVKLMVVMMTVAVVLMGMMNQSFRLVDTMVQQMLSRLTPERNLSSVRLTILPLRTQ